MKEVKVVELFAGVGGFHVGLKNASKKYKVVWSNQWEPATKTQEASEVYIKRFGGESHCNKDITTVPTSKIPTHDMLVGGFPCQDYSVARTLNQAAGLQGKKGVLWWEIYRILKEKRKKPSFLFLENVDRLLKSPANQRGRDFAIMLASLSDLGYIVEWRVINAADYGMPQRRRRVFFLGYHKSTLLNKQIKNLKKPDEWILQKGVIAETFKVKTEWFETIKEFKITGDLVEVSNEFNQDAASTSPFKNTGLMIDRKIWTTETTPDYQGPYTTLRDIILLNGAVPKEYYLDPASVDRWMYLKGAKKEKRTNKINGIEYHYNEGPMSFPDPLDKPARTIITAEGGASPSRFKHVIQAPDGRLRRLTPLELERLNMFPDNHTEGFPDKRRAFFMGNALVVGIIEKIGKTLADRI